MPVESNKVKFAIKLKDAHQQSGLTPYRVSKHTGLSQTTIRKYTDSDEVITEYIPSAVVVLAQFYDVNWRDPAIVDVITAE